MSTEVDRTAGVFIIATTLGIGLVLCVLSLPRAGGYFQLSELPLSVARALDAGNDLPEPMLSIARQSYLDALSLLPNDANLQRDFGRLELRRATLQEDGPQHRREALESASEHFAKAIAAAPSQSFSWSLEAYVRSEIAAPAAGVNKLLRMSYYLGPHEGSSILLRARVAGRMWESLDADVQQFAENDIREIWRYEVLRRILVDIYLNSSFSTRIKIRELILVNAQNEKKFNELLSDAVKSPGG